jgi:hypothetical protein
MAPDFSALGFQKLENCGIVCLYLLCVTNMLNCNYAISSLTEDSIIWLYCNWMCSFITHGGCARFWTCIHTYDGATESSLSRMRHFTGSFSTSYCKSASRKLIWGLAPQRSIVNCPAAVGSWFRHIAEGSTQSICTILIFRDSFLIGL